MDPSRFTKPAGSITNQPARDGRPYACFIPSSLPPPLDPVDLANLSNLLSEASLQLGQLAGLGRLLPNPALLVRPYARREAIASSRIEDTHTSFTDLVAFESGGHRIGSPETREVHNYVLALEFGLRHVREEGITPHLVRMIHKQLMTGARGERFSTPGEFRNVQNHIGGGSNHPADARFVPPPPGEAMVLLDQLFGFVADPSSGLPALIEVALIHYQFETIHPFLDGNGRVGRVLIPLLLALRHQIDHPLLYLSPFFERDRSRYYDLLFGVSARSDWLSWLQYFLSGVTAEATAGVQLASQIIALGKDWHERLTAAKASQNAHRLSDYVHEVIGLDPAAAKRFLEVAPQTAYNAIATLENVGIIEEITGSKRGQIFIAKELVNLLQTAH
ncbi:MAG: Fic family protein [Dehalococcoidia bacterium]